jgi:hypothetical protein
MATDPFEVLMEVEALLQHPASAKNVEKAHALLAGHDEKMLLSTTAKVLVLLGRPDEALVKCDEANAYSSSLSWPRFWRAAALVMKHEPATRWVPELAAAFKGDRSVAREALRQPAFESVRGSAAFLEALGRGKDLAPEIARLVELSEDAEPWTLWLAASELSAHGDQASVHDAKIFALEVILEDIDEHGEANLDQYGDQPVAFFVDQVTAARAAREKLGDTRSAFASARG